MNRNILFVVTTLLLVWIFQTLFVFLVPSAFPTPHWLLLATLAFGLRNSTRLAMTLGFFWGLAADAYGATAFGTQGWLLMLAGAAAGLSARELNADKLITQITVAALGTVVLFGGAMVLRGFFLQTVPMVAPGLGHLVIGVILNACAAPAVFWAQSVWISAWRAPVEGDRE
ncbi:MAG: rod shape-determining protein MreD [Elusimicrobia bacterium]|nr:rod shape-determining protein MreD [Elusimicrobiota bacterium]MBK8651541.1 rod shape-determining protein MreD [Elusimicrobiota bacterium]MBK9429004.1 rod shape-determining protein MreD [Elusimicrobiota bacterium]MBL0250331.1 rod shape-determining protein MreD [Elusimicrobiota bacterium]